MFYSLLNDNKITFKNHIKILYKGKSILIIVWKVCVIKTNLSWAHVNRKYLSTDVINILKIVLVEFDERSNFAFVNRKLRMTLSFKMLSSFYCTIIEEQGEETDIDSSKGESDFEGSVNDSDEFICIIRVFAYLIK